MRHPLALLLALTAGCAARTRRRRSAESLALSPDALQGRALSFRQDADAGQAAVPAMNAFGNHLLAHLAALAPTKNAIVAPPAAYLPLALATVGARGRARNALATGLPLLDGPDTAAALFRYLVRLELAGQFRLAAALWLPAPHQVTATYREQCRGIFPARLESLPSTGTDVINGWCRRSSLRRFERLVVPSDLVPNEGLLLTSLANFTDRWLHPLERKISTGLAFVTGQGERRRTPFLANTHSALEVAQTPTGVAVRIPYANYRSALLVVLPTPGSSPLRALATGDFRHARAFSRQPVALALPEFSVDRRLPLHTLLAKSKLAPAFDPERQDFAAAGLPQGGIARFWQRARLATGPAGSDIGGALAQSAPSQRTAALPLRFDRPFGFALIDLETGADLLCGVIQDPTQPD